MKKSTHLPTDITVTWTFLKVEEIMSSLFLSFPATTFLFPLNDQDKGDFADTLLA